MKLRVDGVLGLVGEDRRPGESWFDALMSRHLGRGGAVDNLIAAVAAVSAFKYVGENLAGESPDEKCSQAIANATTHGFVSVAMARCLEKDIAELAARLDEMWEAFAAHVQTADEKSEAELDDSIGEDLPDWVDELLARWDSCKVVDVEMEFEEDGTTLKRCVIEFTGRADA